MKTEILKPTKKNIEKLALYIKNDEPVAFPTDTVYGIGADCFSDNGVEKIYEIKGRPKNKPLLLLVEKNYPIGNLVKEVNKTAKILMEKYWPGALTLVFDLKIKISEYASAGFSTVGIRVPNDKNAQELLKCCGVPLATPSANMSGMPSPISAQDVYSGLGGRVIAILDGGTCKEKIPSTIVDVTTLEPKIVREGAIKKEEILSTIQNAK